MHTKEFLIGSHLCTGSILLDNFDLQTIDYTRERAFGVLGFSVELEEKIKGIIG